jgi:hypothetical protein
LRFLLNLEGLFELAVISHQWAVGSLQFAESSGQAAVPMAFGISLQKAVGSWEKTDFRHRSSVIGHLASVT